MSFVNQLPVDEKFIESMTNEQLLAYLRMGDDAFYFNDAFDELERRLKLSEFIQ